MRETGRATQEVRALPPQGTTLRVGPLRSAIDGGLLAHRSLVEGRAVRVELDRSYGGRATGSPAIRPTLSDVSCKSAVVSVFAGLGVRLGSAAL